MITKIVSGGQTGADIAALDVALQHGFPHGGWCPNGRKCYEGLLPAQYQLVETPSAGYLQRTEWNVRDHDGTVVFTLAEEVAGDSLATLRFATKHGKPCIHIAREAFSVDGPVVVLARFVKANCIGSLNVAGSSVAREPGIYEWVSRILNDAFFAR